MDVKEAVHTAKKHVAEIFADEAIANVGLEEVEFDELNGVWAITIGFSRSRGRVGDVIRAMDGDMARTFKVVRMEDRSGRVQSVRYRDVTGDR